MFKFDALCSSFKDLRQCVVALIREVPLACMTHRFVFCDHLVVEMIGLCQTFCGEFSQETLSLKGAHFPEDLDITEEWQVLG